MVRLFYCSYFFAELVVRKYHICHLSFVYRSLSDDRLVIDVIHFTLFHTIYR